MPSISSLPSRKMCNRAALQSYPLLHTARCRLLLVYKTVKEHDADFGTVKFSEGAIGQSLRRLHTPTDKIAVSNKQRSHTSKR